MEPGQLIHALLLDAPAVTALVQARVYALRIRQGEPRPAITLQVVGDVTDTLAACPGNEAPKVQVSLFADTYPELCALARAVKNVLHGYRDGQVTIDYENGIDQPYEPDSACYHRVQDYALDYPADAIEAPPVVAPIITNAVFAAA
jgi:hypothetical protein